MVSRLTFLKASFLIAPVLCLALTGAVFAQSSVKILKYDKKGNVIGADELDGRSTKKSNKKVNPSAPDAGTAAPESTEDAEQREILVANPPVGMLLQLQQRGYELIERIMLDSLAVEFLRMRTPEGRSADEALQELRQAFPDTLSGKNTLFTLSAKPSASGTYANQAIGWGESSKSCGKGLKIGMIDTAVNTKHPALKDRKIIHRSFIKNKDREGKSDHGNNVAVLLVGNEFQGLPGGLLPAATLYAGSFFEERFDGRLRGNLSAMMKAMDWMVRREVPVINLSFAGSDNKVLRLIIKRALDKGVVFVAAAGNNGPKAAPAYPAANPSVLAVTAVDQRLVPYRFANRGSYIDFAAPGVEMRISASADGRLLSGTSFATPFITSMVALELRNGVPADSEALRKKLRGLAKDLGSPGRDDVFGWGMVQYRPKC